jgi:uncharacterized protein (DUF2147 family)
MTKKINVIAVGLLILAGAGPGLAADPKGVWLTADSDAQIRIAPCDDALCGTVVWLRDPLDPETGRPLLDKQNPDASRRRRPVIGIPILLQMRQSGANRWSGKIYNADDGNTYDGHLSPISDALLKIEGCLFGFCQSQNWTRIVTPPPARPQRAR